MTLFARVRRLWRPRRTARRERRRRARRSSRTDRPEVSRVEDTRAGTSRRRPWSIQTSSARSGTRKKSFLVRKTEAGRAGSGLDASPTCVRSFVPKEKNAVRPEGKKRRAGVDELCTKQRCPRDFDHDADLERREFVPVAFASDLPRGFEYRVALRAIPYKQCSSVS